MTASPAAEVSASPAFGSLAEMQARHASLAREAGPGPPAPAQASRIVEFIRRGLATGAILDAREDRAAAQGLINFWAARLSTSAADPGHRSEDSEALAPSSGAPPDPYPEDTLLAEFDPATIESARRDADLWLDSLSEEDRASARCILLRMVRLGDPDRTFAPTPTTRAALYDIDGLAPDRADSLVAALAKTGVVRVTPGASPRVDQIGLRDESLLSDWPTLRGYLGRRLAFRDSVAEWEKVGRKDKVLPRGDALDEIRNYRDRNNAEAQYIDASRRKQWRESQKNFVLLCIATPLLLVAVSGWILAGYRAKAEHKNATEATKAKQDAVEKGRTLDAQKRIVESRNEALKEKQHLTEMTALIRALSTYSASAVDTEANRAEREIARIRLEKADDPSNGNDEFVKFFDENRAKLEGIKNEPDAATLREVQMAALNLGREVKEKVLGMSDPEMNEVFGRERDVVFEIVGYCARSLCAKYDGGTYDAAAVYRAEFWNLYWGEMGLVEGDEVAQAMYQFGKVLEEIDRSLFERIKSSKEFSITKPWKGLDSRQAIQQFAIDSAHQAKSHLLTSLREQPVDRGEVEKLKAALAALQAALAKERRQKPGFMPLQESL